MLRGSYPPGFLKKGDTTPITPSTPHAVASSITPSTPIVIEHRDHRSSGHKVPTITSNTGGELPVGHVPLTSGASNVCPCCAGTGMLESKEVNQDGFRYIPDVGVWFRDQRLHLPPSEQRILGALLANPGRVVAKEGLIAYLDTEADVRVIDVWTCRIRRYLKKRFGLEPIVTVWGRGLMWDIRATS